MKYLTNLLLIVLAVVALALPSRAQNLGDYVHVSAGVNGAWFDGAGSAFPVDVEAAGTGWASLSPHISAVGGVFGGLTHSYLRYQGGVRVTTSDVDNPNFNTFLGIVYRGGSTHAVQPSEWAPQAGFGWRPDPVRWPRLALGGEAAYGAQSQRVIATLSARYIIPLN